MRRCISARCAHRPRPPAIPCRLHARPCRWAHTHQAIRLEDDDVEDGAGSFVPLARLRDRRERGRAAHDTNAEASSSTYGSRSGSHTLGNNLSCQNASDLPFIPTSRASLDPRFTTTRSASQEVVPDRANSSSFLHAVQASAGPIGDTLHITDAFVPDSHIDTASFKHFDLEASQRLLQIPPNSFLTALDLPALSPVTYYSEPALTHILRTCKVDHAGLEVVVHHARTAIPFYTYKKAGQVVHRLIRKCLTLNHTPLLPTVVDLFLQRMQSALVNEEVRAGRAQKAYSYVVDAFKVPLYVPNRPERRNTRMDGYHHRMEAERLFRHLIQALSMVPNKPPSGLFALQPELIRRFCRDEVLTSELAVLLFRYVLASEPGIHGFDVLDSHREDIEMAARDTHGAPGNSDRSLDWATNKAEETPPRLRNLELITTAAQRGLEEFAATAMPFLVDPLPGEADTIDQTTREYVWSMLLTQVAKSDSVTRDQLIDMYRHIPDSCICAHTLTPVMQGLSRQEATEDAWNIWTYAVSRQQQSSSPGRYVDKILLAVATEICARTYSFEHAVQLVDMHAQKQHITAGGGRIQLDAQNVNVLLTQCINANKPSVAFRIFNAALPRWGVRPDQDSLSRLMDAARFYEFRTLTWAERNQPGQFRLIMQELSLRWKNDSDFGPHDEKVNAKRFATGDYTVLLDPPGYKWTDHNGPRKPWERARSLFRRIVFDNYPSLHHIKSPLEPKDDLSGPMSLLTTRLGPPADEVGSVLEAKSRWRHVVPNPHTWHSYIMLLGTFGRVDEIALALAWMKSIGIKPLRYTLVDALMYVSEVEGPARFVRGWRGQTPSRLARDQDILRAWLKHWLGDGTEDKGDGGWVSIVPDEEEVRERRSMMIGQGRKLILWE